VIRVCKSSGKLTLVRLIRDGAAIPFTAHATSPTITMPRIKAMTTGSIPSFLDMILSFDEADKTSSLATQDTWLAQLKAQQTGKLVMYGDDTWLKLFPDTFDRADGTSSFFVADFTEVDNNVTRHVPEELKKDDWSGMVLHYLGLDHIGHKTGPKGPNMLVKQREMDRMVREVYTAMEAEAHLQSALFIICGDHGMNDAGNHGASSPGETSPALAFISPKLRNLGREGQPPKEARDDFQYYGLAEQSDIVPTLAALLGFPVPKNNLGAIIPDFLPLWTRSDDKLQLLLRNAHQILGIVTSAIGDEQFHPDKIRETCANPDSDLKNLACEWTDVADWAIAEASKREPESEWIERISAVSHCAR
jgi:ethanolamine phosphate transferase 2 subunit G